MCRWEWCTPQAMSLCYRQMKALARESPMWPLSSTCHCLREFRDERRHAPGPKRSQGLLPSLVRKDPGSTRSTWRPLRMHTLHGHSVPWQNSLTTPRMPKPAGGWHLVFQVPATMEGETVPGQRQMRLVWFMESMGSKCTSIFQGAWLCQGPVCVSGPCVGPVTCS